MPVRKSANRIPSSPVKNILEEEAAPMKQGIVTILGSDFETGKPGSIRRTLSADMSSKKWLQQNGFFSPMKKIVSSEALVRASEEEEEDEETPNQDDVWRSIQAQKEIDEMQKPAQTQVWGLLLTQKSENSVLPPPYVHPLVKTSASSLSEKSLEICTESLGSETGSDCFSNYSCSEILTDGEEDKEERQRVVGGEELDDDSNSFQELHVAQYKKSPATPFPPPIPSIAGGDGPSLHMHSHRENGRLVVEAVSVPPRNYFHAQRHGGRLLLTLVHAPAAPSDEVGESEKVFGHIEEVEEEEEEEVDEDDGGGDEVEEKVDEFVMKPKMIKVDKSFLGTKKFITLGNNINPTWPKKMNKVDEEEEELPITQSLPPVPPVSRLIQRRPTSAAASFNAYEYFWRNKTAVSGGLIANRSPNKMNQDLVVLRGDKTEQFVPYFRGCKEARRTPLSWEPYCIATS